MQLSNLGRFLLNNLVMYGNICELEIDYWLTDNLKWNSTYICSDFFWVLLLIYA